MTEGPRGSESRERIPSKPLLAWLNQYLCSKPLARPGAKTECHKQEVLGSISFLQVPIPHAKRSRGGSRHNLVGDCPPVPPDPNLHTPTSSLRKVLADGPRPECCVTADSHSLPAPSHQELCMEPSGSGRPQTGDHQSPGRDGDSSLGTSTCGEGPRSPFTSWSDLGQEHRSKAPTRGERDPWGLKVATLGQDPQALLRVGLPTSSEAALPPVA